MVCGNEVVMHRGKAWWLWFIAKSPKLLALLQSVAACLINILVFRCRCEVEGTGLLLIVIVGDAPFLLLC